MTQPTNAAQTGPAHAYTYTPSAARQKGQTLTPAQLAQLEYLDVKEAATLLRINHEIIRKAIRGGELEAADFGSPKRPVYRIAQADLQAWRAARSTVSRPAAGGQ